MKRMTAKVDIAPVTDCPVGGFSALFQVPERASTRRRSANRQNRESYHDIVSTIFEHNTEVMEEMLIKNAKAGDLAQIALILQRRAEVLFNIDAKDPATGSTALMWAASNGHSKIVQLLLRHGADVTVRNNDGVTAIELTSPLVRQMLLESVEQGGAHNAFCQAAWQGNASLLKKLLAQHAVSVNCQNADHVSPILLATRDIQLFEKLGSFASGANYSPVEVIRELLNHGADLTVADDSQMTALHYICSGGSPLTRTIALSLLQAGASPDARDRRNATPLHYASQKGNTDVVVALLESGANPNAKDLSGATPLHLTARHGHDQTTTVLVQHGADIFVADEDGLTPLDVAKNKAIKLTLRQAWLSSSNKTKGAADTPVETRNTEKGVEHGPSVTTGGSMTQSKDAVHRGSSSDAESVIANGVVSGNANYSRHVKGSLVTYHPLQVKPNSDHQKQLTRGQTRIGGKGMACHPTPRSPKGQRSGSCRVTFPDTEDAVQNKKAEESQKARYECTNFLPHLSQNSPSPVAAADQDGSRRRNSDDKPLVFEDLFPDAPDEPKTSNNSKPGSARFPKPSSCPVISQMTGATGRSSQSPNTQSPRNSDAQCFSPKYIPHLASIFFNDIDRVYRNVCQKEEGGLKLIEVDGNSSEDRCTSIAAKSSASPLHSKPFKSILREGDFNIDDTRVRKSDDSGCPDDGAANSNSISSSSSTSNVSTSIDIQDLASSGQKNSLNKDTSKKGLISASKEEANLSKNSNVNGSTELHHGTTTDTGIKVTRVKPDASNGVGTNSFSSNPIVKKKIDVVKTEEACQTQVQNSVKATVVLVKPPPSSSSVKPTLNLSSGAESSAKNSSGDKVPLKVSELANEDALPVAAPRRYGSFREKTQTTSNKSNDTLNNTGQSEVDNRNVTQTKDSTRTKGSDAKTQVLNLKKQDENAVPVASTGGSTSTGNSAIHRPGRSASCGPGNRGLATTSAESDTTKKTAQQATNTLKQSRCDKKVNSTVPITGKLDGSSPSLVTEQETKTVPGKAGKASVKESEVKADSSVRRVGFSPAVAGSFQATSVRNVSVNVASSFDNTSSPADNVEFLVPRRSASFRHGTWRDGNRFGHGGPEMFIRKDLHADPSAKTGNILLPRPVVPEKQSLHNKTTIPKGQTSSSDIPLPPQSHYATHHREPGSHSTYQQSSTSENQPSSQKSSSAEHKSSSQKLTASESQSSSQKPHASENLVSSNKSNFHINQTSAQKMARTHLRTTATDVKTSSTLSGIGIDKKASGEAIHVSSSHQKAYVSTIGEGSQKLPGQSKAAIIIKQIRSRLSSSEQQKFTAQKISNSLGKDKYVDVEIPKNVKAVASSTSKSIPKETTCFIGDTSSHKSTSSPCSAQMDENLNKQESISVLPEDNSRKSISKPNECPVVFRVAGTIQNGIKDLEECSGQSGVAQGGSKPVPRTVSIVTARPAQIIHTGPVICDPFESLKLRQESAMAAAKIIPCDTPENSKTPTVPKSAKQRPQIVNSAKIRQQPKKTRQPSATLGISTARPKSKSKFGRRERNRRKSKKNCTELYAETSREEELVSGPDVKLIGGIGWHVAARPADAKTREEDREEVILLHDSYDDDSSETVQSSSQSTGRSVGESLHSENLDQSIIRNRDTGNVTLLETGPAGQHVKSSPPKKVSGRKSAAITGVRKVTTAAFELGTDKSAFSERDTSQPGQHFERHIPDAVVLPKETGFRSGRGSGLQVAKSEPVGNAALLKVMEETEEEVTVRVLPASPRDQISARSVCNQQKKDKESSSMAESDRIGTSAAYDGNLEEMNQEILETTPNPSLSSSAKRKWKTKQKEKADYTQNSDNRDTGISSHRTLTSSLSGTVKSDEPGSDSFDPIRESGRGDHYDHLYESIVTGKPPMSAKSSVTSDQSFQALERSPRFVRKHDSVTLLHREKNPSSSEDENSQARIMEAVISNLQQLDDSLLSTDQNAKLVTSRLGRSCTQSRTGSANSSAPSGGGDDVETIQWKRGNMLGKGAYGTVWCGLTNSGELIAVKMIELNTSNLEKAEAEYEQIQEEVELLKTLKHKNIVGYLGTSLEENFVSIFMQFVPGGSIASIIARFGSLEEEVFCNYTKQILEGVEYLHANDVIHRDIKGGNIMVMHNGIIKLIDFGCAKKLCLNITSLSADVSPLLKSMRGTPYWMAPEVVREDGHGVQSDIWSIGCTVFEMATKKPPWSDYQPTVAIFTIGCDSKPIPQLPSKFSEKAHSFVNACLTRDPSKRPSASQLLRHAFIVNHKRPKTSSLS